MATPQPTPQPQPTAATGVMNSGMEEICNHFIAKYHAILMHKATVQCGEEFNYPVRDTTGWTVRDFMKAVKNLIDLSQYMKDEYAVPNSVAWTEGKSFGGYSMWCRRWEAATRFRFGLELYEQMMEAGYSPDTPHLQLMAGLIASI